MQASNTRLVDLLRRSNPEDLSPLYDLLEDKVEGRPSNPDELADHLRRWGSNTLVTWVFRWGDGVNYDEVVRDVADALKVERGPGGDERDVELAIVGKIVQEYLKTASPTEREEIEKILKQAGADATSIASHLAAGGSSFVTLLLSTVGARVTQQVVKAILLRMLSRQAAKEGMKQIARFAALAVPFLNIVMGAWLVLDIAGPAYRKTVPAVVRVALLRLSVDGQGEEVAV